MDTRVWVRRHSDRLEREPIRGASPLLSRSLATATAAIGGQDVR